LAPAQQQFRNVVPILPVVTTTRRAPLLCVLASVGVLTPHLSIPADHNDLNAIFWDVKMNGADLYDLLGFPTQTAEEVERVMVALTFGAVPDTGVQSRSVPVVRGVHPPAPAGNLAKG